jgi:hypothetical protein
MNDDDRLHSYLADRAAAITLPPADLGATTRRGARRRTRRRAAIASLAAVAVTATTLSVFDRGGDGTAIDSGLAVSPAVPSSFDWTVVSPTAGLGFSESTTLAGGAVYGLSTAPGPVTDASYQPHLYRSEDGSGWSEVQLPADLHPTALAGYGDTVYALGTVLPDGSGQPVMASSQDGGASWSTVQLPTELAELQARHPGEIQVNGLAIAAKDATHLVVSVTVHATPNLERLDPEVRELLDGRTYAYVSDDGSTFESASLPAGLEGWGGPLLATDEGYVLFSAPSVKSEPTVVLRSVDGHSWTDAGSVPWIPVSAGVVNGRAAVSVIGGEIGLDVLIAQPDGTWAPLDLLAAVGEQTDTVGVADVAFGPLGVAALIISEARASDDPQSGPSPLAIVHSSDGATVSAVPLADHFAVPQAPIGLTVTADAIVARFNEPRADDPEGTPVQHALVGTPR